MTWTAEKIEKIVSNPFYCLRTVAPYFTAEHEPLISEESWIQAGAKLIGEIGAEQYLRRLLENLKGNDTEMIESGDLFQ
jgi:hypothetical protein